MNSNAEIYQQAAEQHVTVAREMYDLRRYVLTHYVGGLAVECIFRAYRHRLNAEFHSRHNLKELYEASRFAEIVPVSRQEEASEALSEVITRWSNTYRFYSSDALRADLKRRLLYRGIKGDFVKESARRLVQAGTVLVTIGVQQWQTSPRK